jgi:signal transduction histidine kinase
MNRMIDQLLWLAKLRNMDTALTNVNMNEVVRLALLRFTDVIEQKDIKVDIAPSLPCAQGHAQWVEEIFANLISNAIKYMGDDNPTPRIGVCAKPARDQVRYEVIDTGVGIKPEDQTSLFEMFTRLHSIEADGLGIGLSIAHRIVNKLGGDIGVESTYGAGSTFWFTLPAVIPPAEKSQEPESATPR